ncbi:MAG: bacteriohemerythrin [Rhodocyclaceae bacterium]|nr:bacteriohemerythrin [Rhodocyclaceae bacterium]MDZ4215333.1 bacteriohemerythrin [Rhodocyclaceae bacterium]
MPLTWTNTLSIGIRQIDLQHQELIELINALEAAHASGQRQAALEEVLPKLSAYVLFHFATEEAMMPRTLGDHAERHRLQHQVFTERVEALRSMPPERIDLAELIAYLKQWLVEHIMKTDRELARLIAANSR